ncbi:cob(I)yrinic acid a,c-diamide adenosyltransferase [Porphyromonas macacae]|uniref:cob(I)yrinic acid a,c-diamide adenosyltransferase n=1 Tax=Porphyromonas macacae TaxID=28115 RepID=UPI0024AE26ED|nr:cob(I)yrinic acid a,c-diamide adenosyltransferase [Porphyromonas macacae]
MDKKSLLYTKTGDKGMTGLVGGKRVPKHHIRLESYGTIDELNSFVGMLMAQDIEEQDYEFLLRVQHKLFNIGSYLATESDSTEFITEKSKIHEEDVQKVEREIDRLDGMVPRMKAFVLPGGGKSASVAHVCRTVCRRAERIMYRLNEEAPLNDLVLKYVNRLSDYFFALARKEVYRTNGEEICWDAKYNG